MDGYKTAAACSTAAVGMLSRKKNELTERKRELTSTTFGETGWIIDLATSNKGRMSIETNRV